MRDAEFIIVFDGENKELQSICNFYKKTDPRFKIFIQPHLGVSATRNFGIKQANGEYVTFVDADDFIEKDCCEETYNFAKQNNSVIVLFDYIPVDKQFSKKDYSIQNIPLLSARQIEELQKETILTTDDRFVAAVSTWCKFFKKSFLEDKNILFPTSCQKSVDRPFSFLAFSHTNKISYLKRSFYKYNKVRNSISNSFYENFFLTAQSYLIEIKKSNQNFNSLISKQTIGYFYNSWSKYYFTQENKKKFFDTVQKLCTVIKSEQFQYLIRDIKLHNYPVLIKIELLFFLHQITLPIWLHALKWRFLNHE